MAQIKTSKQIPPVKIDKFLGLNENIEGEYGLKLGEASKQIGFRVTSGYQLKRMEGYKTILNFGTGNIQGMTMFKNKLIVAHGGNLYEFEQSEL